MAKDIHNAAGYGSEKEVSRFLNQGVSVDLADHEGAAPLARAARFGHLAVAELLLASGATVDKQDNAGRTALHLAASMGIEPVLNLLIRAGANMEATEARGETPLMYAAGSGQFSTADALIKSGAKVNAQDHYGFTALVHSFLIAGSDYEQRLRVIRLLIASDANPVLRDREGKTAVEVAEGIDHDQELLAILQQATGAPVTAQRWNMLGGQACVLCDKLRRWTPSKTHPDYINPDLIEEWIGTSLPGRVKNGPGTFYRGKQLIKLQILEAWHDELCDRSLASDSTSESDVRKGGAGGSP